MKRSELIKLLEANGWKFIREGSKHTIFEKGDQQVQVPRHKEINELLARSLIKKLDLQ